MGQAFLFFLLCAGTALTMARAEVRTGGNVCVNQFLNILPDPDDCRNYILCFLHKQYVFKCPRDLLYDPASTDCVTYVPENCRIPISNDTTTTSTTTTEPPTTTDYTTTTEPPTTTNPTTTTEAPTTTNATTTTEAPTTTNPTTTTEAPTTTNATTTTEGPTTANLSTTTDSPTTTNPTTTTEAPSTTNPTTTTEAPTTTNATTTTEPPTTTNATTTTEPPTTTTKPSPVCTIDTLSLSADINNCKLYYECFYGTILHYRCGKNLRFDNPTKTCLPKEIANCLI